VQLNRSLQRGLAVLEAVADSSGPVGPTRITELTDLDKATVSRLLATFEHAGYVIRDAETGRARLTSRVLRLSRGYLEHCDLRTLAHPHLGELRDASNETAHLGVLTGDRVVYIDKMESSNSVRLVSAVGQTMPVHTTALGKAMVAALEEQVRAPFLEQLDLCEATPATMTDQATLLEELDRTAQRGWSIDAAENEPNVLCIGAAILDGDGSVVGAVSVSGPQFRMEPRIDELGELCRSTADRIAAEVPTGELESLSVTNDEPRREHRT
jgi:DNA-binding IclR family transcriptional regulator